MSNLICKSETQTYIDENGKVTTSIKETTSKIERNEEPDYIKLYTKMWCEYNQIPFALRALFLALVARMNYASTLDEHGGQIVYVAGPNVDSIMKELNLSDRSTLTRGLNGLVKCNAIKRVARSCYQINPQYAGRGEWKYNPKLKRGGVEDLVATFNFKDGTVNTKIVWADDSSDDSFSQDMRKALSVRKEDNAILKIQELVPGQLVITDTDMHVNEELPI